MRSSWPHNSQLLLGYPAHIGTFWIILQYLPEKRVLWKWWMMIVDLLSQNSRIWNVLLVGHLVSGSWAFGHWVTAWPGTSRFFITRSPVTLAFLSRVGGVGVGVSSPVIPIGSLCHSMGIRRFRASWYSHLLTNSSLLIKHLNYKIQIKYVI